MGIRRWPGRAAAAVAAMMAALLLACAGPVGGRADQGGAGEVSPAMVQVCVCLGSGPRAEEMAARYRGMVPGLETEVRAVEVGGRTVHEIWARHPEMSPARLCRAIGLADCRGGKAPGGGCPASQ